MVWDFSTEPEFQAQLDWVDVLARDPELAAAADMVERDLFARG